MTSDPTAAIPLYLLHEDEVESWLETQAPPIRRWAQEQNFKGERHRVVLIPEASGSVMLALAGLGRRQGALSLWHGAGIAERLPARRFRLVQSFAAADATAVALGFAYAAYRFERYKRPKPESPASLEHPADADRVYITNAARSAWAGARHDQHTRRRFRTGRTRRGGARTRTADRRGLCRVGR